MKFNLSYSWPYDPLGVISSMIIEQNSIPYTHISKSEIEYYANHNVWEENTLQEVEDKISSQIALESPRLKEKELKIPSESMSPTGSSFRPTKFKVFKRRKTMNVEEESSKIINLVDYTTIILSCEPVYSL